MRKDLTKQDLVELDKWRCIMVDVVGETTEECDVTNLPSELTSDNIRDYVADKSTLAADVRKFMESRWNLTDSGGGCGGWHFGCYCTWVEARELVDALREKFKKALAAGLIKIRPKVWSAGRKI